MGSLSIWHWVIIITIIGVPILLATRYRSRTPLPFDPSLPTAPADLNWKQIYFGLNGRITRKTWWLFTSGTMDTADRHNHFGSCIRRTRQFRSTDMVYCIVFRLVHSCYLDEHLHQCQALA